MEVVRTIERVRCRSGDTDSPVCITACGEGEGTVVGGWTRRRKSRAKKLSVVHQKFYVLTKEYFLVVSNLLV